MTPLPPSFPAQEGCPVWVKVGCELLSLVQLLVQTAAGALLGVVGVVLLWHSDRGNRDPQHMYYYLFVTVKELLIGKLMGLFVVRSAPGEISIALSLGYSGRCTQFGSIALGRTYCLPFVSLTSLLSLFLSLSLSLSLSR